jgi:hypothetical protein
MLPTAVKDSFRVTRTNLVLSLGYYGGLIALRRPLPTLDRSAVRAVRTRERCCWGC